MSLSHGTQRSYDEGCACQLCTDKNTKRQQAKRARRKARAQGEAPKPGRSSSTTASYDPRDTAQAPARKRLASGPVARPSQALPTAPRTIQESVRSAPARWQAPTPASAPAAIKARMGGTKPPAPVAKNAKQIKAEIRRLAGLLGYNSTAVAGWEGAPPEILTRLEGLARGRQLI